MSAIEPGKNPVGIGGLGGNVDTPRADHGASYERIKPEGVDTTHGAILYLENITVSFDGFKAINNLNLDISVGELRCIIGPNGAGKTTMMDVITGKTRPTAGTAFFGQTIDFQQLPVQGLAGQVRADHADLDGAFVEGQRGGRNRIGLRRAAQLLLQACTGFGQQVVGTGRADQGHAGGQAIAPPHGGDGQG